MVEPVVVEEPVVLEEPVVVEEPVVEPVVVEEPVVEPVVVEEKDMYDIIVSKKKTIVSDPVDSQADFNSKLRELMLNRNKIDNPQLFTTPKIVLEEAKPEPVQMPVLSTKRGIGRQKRS